MKLVSFGPGVVDAFMSFQQRLNDDIHALVGDDLCYVLNKMEWNTCVPLLSARDAVTGGANGSRDAG